jgi:Heterokaryon incompatibility protein (HET)
MEMSTHSAGLCLQCQKINFAGLIREDPDHEDNALFRFGASYDLGSSRDILQRKGECRLCHIFVSCLEEAFDGIIPLGTEETTIKCELQEAPVASLPIGGNKKSVYKLGLLLEAEADGSTTAEIDLPEFSTELRFQATTPAVMAELADLKPASPRPRPLQCDFEQLKTWLTLCERVHGPLCCVSESYSRPGFRLIDAHNRCIIDASVLDSLPRYLALSYVWGSGAQKWNLTSKSVEDVGRKGFLDTVSVATTIDDAIELVCMLGERFLWVDSKSFFLRQRPCQSPYAVLPAGQTNRAAGLCILQDSEEDKLQQIPHMGAVYEHSLITIVAASAKDANGGLPGVRPGTRKILPHFLQTEALILASALETEFENPVIFATEYWPTNSRKWTFQEGLLSRRCLFFSKEQVYWQCQRTMWSEELLLQPTRESAFDKWTLSSLQRIYVNMNAVTSGSGEEFWKTYRRLIRTYSDRSITYPTDALHAFQGVISVITRLTGVEFIWALPQPGFEFYLLWGLNSRLSGGRSATTVFPSWSWLAWKGSVLSPLDSEIPELRCYFLECSGVCLDLANTPVSRVQSDHERLQTRPSMKNKNPVNSSRDWKLNKLTVNAQDISTLDVTAPLVGRFHLFFWTSLASLFVCCEEDETYVHLPMKKNDSPECSESTSPETPSNGSTAELGLGRQVGQWPLNDGPTPGATPSLHDFVVVGSLVDYDKPTLTIMMISWIDGIAQREHMATIVERDWMEAERDWRLIVLG